MNLIGAFIQIIDIQEKKQESQHGTLRNFRRLEVREKVSNILVMSLRLSDHQVLYNIASSSRFLDFARIFSLFSLVFRTSKLLEFKKIVIPFAIVGYKTDYSQLGRASLAIYQTPFVRRMDKAIHWINHNPLDNSIGFANPIRGIVIYPVDSVYPPFEEPRPAHIQRALVE